MLRLYSHSGEKLLCLQPNANWVNTLITQWLIDASAGVTTVLPHVGNKNLNTSGNSQELNISPSW